MKPTITIRKALADPRLLGNVLAGASWAAWRIAADRRHGRGADRRRARHVHGS